MRKIVISLFFALLANFVSAEVAKTINNLSAGTLSTVLTATEKTTVTKLKVTGSIDIRDFNCMRDEMTALADVDLLGTSISALSGVGAGANEIPAYAFSTGEGKKTLKSILLPKYAVSVGDVAFMNCTGLTAIKLDTCITAVGREAFMNCTGLSSLTIPECLRTIHYSAFEACSSLSGTLTIPNLVKIIGDNAFTKCTKLTGVVFGSAVDTVGFFAFNNCTALKTIRFTRKAKTMLSSGAFTNIASGSFILIPIKSSAYYVNNSSWYTDSTRLLEYRANVSSKTLERVTFTSVKLTASIDFITDKPVLEHGFCWSINSMPTVLDSMVKNGPTTTLGSYSNTITKLVPGASYMLRPFVTDEFGTFYGAPFLFDTPILPSASGSIWGPAAVYQGQANVEFIVSPIDNATSYIWTLPSGFTGTSTSNTISVSFAKTATSGTISVFGRNMHGDGVAAKLQVVVNSLPKDAGKITGYSVVCQGENQVSYTVPAIDYASTYVWTLPSGATGTSLTNTIVVNYGKTAVSGSVSVVGKNDWGVGAAASLPVTVHQLPVIGLRDTTLTYGSTLALSPAINYTDGGTLKYKWTPATGLLNDTIANPIITVINPITYTLTLTTPYGCTASKDVKIGLKTMDKPVIGIVGIVNSKNRIAWNKPVSQGVASYLIYKETVVSDVYDKIGTVPYDSLSVFVDVNSAPDVKSNKYKISILDKGGMESVASDAHKTMHLSINKGQNGTWNLIWEPYEGFKPLTYNIYRGTSATNLNFLDATSASSTQYTDLEAPASNVYYQLEVISPNLVSPTKATSILRAGNSIAATYNSSRSNVVAGIVNGLEKQTTAIRMYPNPVKDVLNIEMESGSTFEILNLTGQVVFRGDLSKSTRVDASQYKAGLYVVKIKVVQGYEFRKIIKE